MKTNLKVLATGLMMGVLATGCNQQSGSKSPGITTGLSMTGSGQPAVANARFHQLLNYVVPSAIALTPPMLVDSTNSPVSLSEAWVVIKEIEFEATEVAGGSEVDGDEVEFRGPYFVDLLSDAPVSFGEANVSLAGIRRIKMKLHEAESLPASAPVELTSKSILFKGTVGGIAFSYAADDSTELEIGGPNPVAPSYSQDLLVVIRMADLFKKIDLSSIVAPTDIHAGNRVNVANACPTIDPSANDLYTCFRKGLASEGNFGRDDGDKDLDINDDTVK